MNSGSLPLLMLYCGLLPLPVWLKMGWSLFALGKFAAEEQN